MPQTTLTAEVATPKGARISRYPWILVSTANSFRDFWLSLGGGPLSIDTLGSDTSRHTARRGTDPGRPRGRPASAQVAGIAQRSRSVFEPRASDRYHQLDDGPRRQRSDRCSDLWLVPAGFAPMGEADPRKATKNADSKYLAALSDVRLEGSNEAVYFVLRGLGMKASPGPNSLPRIEIMAAQHPRLYAALRRLGLRHLRDTIVLEPSSGTLERLPATSSTGDLKAPRPHDTQSRSSKTLRSSNRMDRKRMAYEVIRAHKAAAPPTATSMLPAAKVQEILAQLRAERRPARNGQGPGPGLQDPPAEEAEAARYSVPCIGARPTRTAEEQEEFFAKLAAAGRHGSPEEALQPGPSLRLRPVRSAEEQKQYFAKLSVPRVVRPKVLPFELGHRVQSSFGRAAERHLLGRLERLHETKQKAIMEQEALEAEARVREVRRALYGDDASEDEMTEGIFPPDPSPEGSEAAFSVHG
eukprot:s1549_g7.t1